MPHPVNQPFRTGEAAPVTFPARCAGCGAPPETHSTLSLSRPISRGQSTLGRALWRAPLPAVQLVVVNLT